MTLLSLLNCRKALRFVLTFSSKSFAKLSALPSQESRQLSVSLRRLSPGLNVHLDLIKATGTILVDGLDVGLIDLLKLIVQQLILGKDALVRGGVARSLTGLLPCVAEVRRGLL